VSQARPAAAVADAGYIDTVMNSPASAARKSLRWLPVCRLESSVTTSLAAATDNDAVWMGYRGCSPSEAYLIQYTSGATGAPRPVMVTAGAAAHNVRAARKAYNFYPGSVVASWVPQYHDCGLMFLLLTVAAGATCVLASPAAFLRRPRLWLELVADFKATCTPVPLFLLPLVLRRGFSDSKHGGRTRRPPLLELESLRNLILVNEPIYKSSVDEFVEHFARDGLDASYISPSYRHGWPRTARVHGVARNRTETLERSLPSYKKLLPSAPRTSGNGDRDRRR
jgi:acyl-CoA synthetase (AMP-forming)/AMP-acid ligase II